MKKASEAASDKFVKSLNLNEKLSIVLLEAKLVLTNKIKLNESDILGTIDAVLDEAFAVGAFDKFVKIGVINKHATIH